MMTMAASPGRLAIAGLGATTSVGWDAACAAASIRADIVRPAGLSEFKALDEIVHDLEPITGHPVAGLTDGFVLFGRWMRLARNAMQDLLAGDTCPAPGEKEFWHRCALLLVTGIADEATFLMPAARIVAATKNDVGLALLQDLELPIPAQQVEVLPLGHVGCAAALERSEELIGTSCDRVVILAVDSLIDPLLLENRFARHRLKCTDNPVGLAPGEAAVALLVEGSHTLLQREGTAVAQVCGVDISKPNGGNAENEERGGRRLSQSYTKALDQAGISRFEGDLYIDLNGEQWRARHWGTALTRILQRFVGTEHLPCLSVGDTGAASGALGVCLAVRSFAREYARSDKAVVLSVAEDMTSSCVVLGHSKSRGVA
jgi:3-oxoacyl-[acyl-carrier-protein] synthase-1